MSVEKFFNNGPLQFWVLLGAVLLSLMLFSGALLWTYWADELQSPAWNEASYPAPGVHASSR